MLPSVPTTTSAATTVKNASITLSSHIDVNALISTSVTLRASLSLTVANEDRTMISWIGLTWINDHGRLAGGCCHRKQWC